MDQLVQCPVCTLFLHNGMSLESHLDTHPKDQVIKALCNLSGNNAGFGSRTSTPMHSERSYRSRSRTPAEDSPRWSGRSIDNERYWRRTPSRCSKTPVSSITRNATPSDVRMGDINFENNSNNATPNPYPGIPFLKSDKSAQPFIQNVPIPEFDQQYIYYPEQQEDKEIKYSRSAEYSAIDNSNNVFTYNMPSVAPGVKLQTSLMPSGSRRSNDLVKLLPKPNNILVKANMGGVQYITPGVKPVHLMVPTAPTFVQKNIQNNMIVSGSIPTSQIMEPKSVASPLASSNTPFSQLSSGTFTPGTTVVTQNSQIIYREMVHNIDGKPFISSMPTMLSGHDNITNVAATSSMYQNVMVVDPFGNTSCMYTTPQQIISKPCNTPIYSEVSMSSLEKSLPSSIVNDANKTLIIEVSPIVTPAPLETSTTTSTSQASQTVPEVTALPSQDKPVEKVETPGPTKGLKILSNIKVEVPVQHHKNLLNTVVDLTGPHEPEYSERATSPERILPDFEDNNHSLSGDCTQPSSAVSNDSIVSNTFSVIKNVGNPPSYKDSVSKSSVDNKIENEFSDSCPMPDLICNEKPSISPCSELSESGEHSGARSPSPRAPPPPPPDDCARHAPPDLKPKPSSSCRSAPLRLNNIFVKKHKKILEIKNSKSFGSSGCGGEEQAGPSAPARPPENFTMNKLHGGGGEDKRHAEPLQTVRVEVCVERGRHEFDADTEERSMDIEPMPHSSRYPGLVHVKEEVNSNESAFGVGAGERELAPLEALRPINVISYGGLGGDEFDDEEQRELLELEAGARGKRFAGVLGDGYFGDGVYAEYFGGRADAALWAGSCAAAGAGAGAGAGARDPEFVLPTFVHDAYRAAEDAQYAELAPPGPEPDPDTKPAREPPHQHHQHQHPPRPDHHADMESPWTGMYTEVATAEPYDLLARESWVSDGEEHDAAEKREPRAEAAGAGAGAGAGARAARAVTCGACRARFPSRADLRAHRAAHHAQPAGSCARAIKEEEKGEDALPPPRPSDADGGLALPDSKEALLSLAALEDKPALEALVKTEPRRRRRDFVCPTCKQDQGSEPAFHQHLKLHPLECLTCGKCFFRRANLALHIKTHLGIKNFKCEVCEKRFLTRQKLMEHHNTHTGRAPYKCTVCDDTFRRYSNMVQHRDRHHLNKKSKVRDFVCQCGAVFHSRAKLRWHRETHEEKPKACLYCSDKFVHAASLTRHVRRAHNQYYTDPRRGRAAADNVPCPVCKQVYLRANLRAHLLTHSGKRPYVCVQCNKGFTTKWNLKLHRWTHASRSAKPYKCTQCKSAFVRHSEYLAHVNAHRAVRPYTCNHCGCRFIRKYNCQRHVREHEAAKRFVCKVPECGKSFHRSYYLSEHMKVHSGARPFACGICGKLSGNKSNHNKHVKIHHAREPVASEA